MMKTRSKTPIAEAVKEEYPYRQEQGDFLRIIEMRESMGTIYLGAGIVFFWYRQSWPDSSFQILLHPRST